MSDRDELNALRRLAELEARSGGRSAAATDPPMKWSDPRPMPAPSTARPSLFRMDSDFQKKTGVGVMPMLGAAARDTFVGRDNAAIYLASKAGGTVGRDSDGSPTVVLPGGEAYRLNDPGLDLNDVASLTSNIGAFLVPAGFASKFSQGAELGLLGRSALQAGAAGATDAGIQAASTGGSVPEPWRAVGSAAGGAGGEVLGSLGGAIKRGVKSASPRSAGSVANAQEEAARLLAASGVIDPPPALIARAANDLPELAAGGDPNAILGKSLFGFDYTLGQRMTGMPGQFRQLTLEEGIRQTPGGGAEFTARELANKGRLADAVSDISGRLGGRPGATPADLAAGAASRIKAQAAALGDQVRAAYEVAGDGGRAAVGFDAVSSLPDRMRNAVADFGVNPELHPAASRTIAQITQSVGKAKESGVKGVTIKAIETQRRIINNNIAAATNQADRAATTAIKREFDGWLDDAVENSLISGDPSALQALKDARQLRFEYGRRFEGREEADRFISGLLDGTRTPEELVNVALGASSVSKAGGARFIQRLKVAADGDPETIGALRSAHFQRLTTGKTGEPLDMGRIVSNIKATEYSNSSIVNALYSPKEWAEIKRLADALDPLIAKGDFAKSSGTAERYMRQMFSKMGAGTPGLGPMLIEPVMTASQGRAAAKVFKSPVRLTPATPAIAPATGAALAADEYGHGR